MNNDEANKLFERYSKMPADELVAESEALWDQWSNSKTFDRSLGGSPSSMVIKTLAISFLLISGLDHYLRGNEKQEFMDKINNGEHVTMIEGMPMYATYPDHFENRMADGEVIKPAHSAGGIGPKVAVTYSPESVAKNGGPSEFSDNRFLFDKIALDKRTHEKAEIAFEVSVKRISESIKRERA